MPCLQYGCLHLKSALNVVELQISCSEAPVSWGTPAIRVCSGSRTMMADCGKSITGHKGDANGWCIHVCMRAYNAYIFMRMLLLCLHLPT